MPAPVFLIRRNSIIRRFSKAGAVSPETAVAPEEAKVKVGLKKAFDSLEKSGFISSCGNGKYYVAQRKNK